MKKLMLVALLAMLVTPLARADSITITDHNSTLKFTRDDPTANLGGPSDPVQLPRKLEWTVDGRRILIYPSSPATFVDIGHLHAGAHVRANQIHAQGPMLGYTTGATTGTVTGGIVYSLDGGAASSGISRLSEKVDMHNKTGANVAVMLTGMGFKPTQTTLEVPDYSGLEVGGTTVVFVHGDATSDSFTETPFAPLTVLPIVSFTGFNPLLNMPFNVPGGAYLTMVTELKVAPAPATFTITIVWLLLILVVVLAGAGAGAMLIRRRRKAR